MRWVTWINTVLITSISETVYFLTSFRRIILVNSWSIKKKNILITQVVKFVFCWLWYTVLQNRGHANIKILLLQYNWSWKQHYGIGKENAKIYLIKCTAAFFVICSRMQEKGLMYYRSKFFSDWQAQTALSTKMISFVRRNVSAL